MEMVGWVVCIDGGNGGNGGISVGNESMFEELMTQNSLTFAILTTTLLLGAR